MTAGSSTAWRPTSSPSKAIRRPCGSRATMPTTSRTAGSASARTPTLRTASATSRWRSNRDRPRFRTERRAFLLLGGFQYACVVFEWQRLGVARYDPVRTRIRPELRRVGAGIERDVDVPAVLGAEVVARGVQQVAVEQHRGPGGTDDRNGFFRLL